MPLPIPQPPGIPLLGNTFDIDAEDSLASILHLAATYGEIFKLTIAGTEHIFVSTFELLDQACDEKTFEKYCSKSLQELRRGVNDGLFTAFNGEHNWGVGHRILMPAFGPLAIAEMFDDMQEIASQLILKWARFGEERKIDVAGDFTKFTFDTIALCAMGARLNSFYSEDTPPFIKAMVDFLLEGGRRGQRFPLENYLRTKSLQKYDSDIETMRSLAVDMVARRRAHPTEKKDLLNALILGRDPVTGEGMTDQSIMDNMITLLVAGHETTSGLLSFCFLMLLQNPAAYLRAQKEVDEVVGKDTVTVKHLPKLPYLNAVLRETMRLNPPVTTLSRTPKATPDGKPVLLGGKYEVKPGTEVKSIVYLTQRDPSVYGADCEEFKPERMLDEEFNKRPANAWKPFGTGVRGCIGRPFAWQEAHMMLAMLLQYFNFRLDDPSYKLKIRQTLTVKPKDFYMHAKLRDGIDVGALQRSLAGAGQTPSDSKHDPSNQDGKEGRKMLILFGSNSGTCEAIGNNLALSAPAQGFRPEVRPLDSAVGSLPKDRPVIIITASYEGEPPDNAAHFVEWLRSLTGSALEGVQFAVFGCGHRDWLSTFHKIPKLVDAIMGQRGASRIVDIGLADAASGAIYNDFDKWHDSALLPALAKLFPVKGSVVTEDIGLKIEITEQTRSTTLRQDVMKALVVENRTLTAPGQPEKKHLQVKLPSGMAYTAGDYLAVLPINNQATIAQVFKRFKLPWDAMLTITSTNSIHLPVGYPVSAYDVLSSYVELNQPATAKNISLIAKAAFDEHDRKELEALASNSLASEITAKHISCLGLLERFPNTTISFEEFLLMLPPLRVRQYSISSSPLEDPTSCTLTYSVLNQSHWSGEGVYLGAASNYLAQLSANDSIQVSVRKSHQAFHLPTEIDQTPLILICAGTGVAPFRGFVQERAIQITAGRTLAPCILFMGCRHPTHDAIYKEEFEKWQSLGAVNLQYAFSQEDSDGCKHVQDRLWTQRDAVADLFRKNARIYVCGSRNMEVGVTEVLKKIYKEAVLAERDEVKSDEETDVWFRGIRNTRYMTDVFD